MNYKNDNDEAGGVIRKGGEDHAFFLNDNQSGDIEEESREDSTIEEL